MLHIFPLMAPSPIKPKMLSHSFGHFSPGQNSKSSVKGYKILNHPIFFERIGNPPSNPQSNPPNCTQLHLVVVDWISGYYTPTSRGYPELSYDPNSLNISGVYTQLRLKCTSKRDKPRIVVNPSTLWQY